MNSRLVAYYSTVYTVYIHFMFMYSTFMEITNDVNF